MSDAYFLKKVPQSELRNREPKRQKSEEEKAAQYLDLSLDDLQLSDQTMKLELKEKIEEAATAIKTELLPEDAWDNQQIELFVKKICVRLGLV